MSREIIEAIKNARGEPADYCVLDGLIMEFGVAKGNTIRHIAALFPDESIYGFDAFEGLPEAWNGNSIGAYSCDIPKVPSNVILIKGWFSDTLPKFCKEHKNEKVAYIHIDCDIYSSTKCVFDNFKHMFQDGSLIQFDEIYGYDGYEEHEMKAFDEFLQETQYQWKCLFSVERPGIGWSAGFEIQKGTTTN